ncbi:hypothetical protein HH212_01880 [Massilia forsythiae]|uniref:Uncharacterized protein n=1 Tax=Massilia forsythiae TaxID=2728020 RepID=A0A7Z2VTF2_9BURK|nr:hypothetical protein [Massilia forsythiae]QJD98936.1 hypothetical protein HH212_01880 [Massilia forsythiae]
MRIKNILAFTGAAVLSACAFAEPSIAPAANPATGSVLVQAKAGAGHRLTAQEAQGMRGAFRLADGRTLTLSSQRNKLFVDLDGKHEELVPVGDKRFVARDSGTLVAFNQVPYADEVTVSPAD